MSEVSPRLGAGRTTAAVGATDRRTWIEVGAVTALAAVLRLPTLDLQSYEVDEVATLVVIQGSFDDMLHGVARHESTPPLYYVLAWLWTQVSGTGETGLRLFSAVAGIATVPVVYVLGRTLTSRRVGLVAAAVVATSPYLVFYSQEARSYSLFALLATLGALCCVRAIQNPGGRTFGLWAGVSIAAVATHYFAVFPVAGQAVALALLAPRRFLAWSVAAIAVASTPLVFLAAHQAEAEHAAWIGASPLLERIRVTAETFALGATFRGTLSHALLAAFAALSVVSCAALVVAGYLLLRRAASDERRAAGIAGLIAAVSIVLPLLGALGPADYFIHKNLIPVLPLLAVVLGAGLGCRRAGWLGTAGGAALVLAGIVLTTMSFAVPALRRPDLRQVSEQLGAPTQDRVIVFVPRWRLLLEHYQGALSDLPPTGRRVSVVDVFTTASTLPAGTVPEGFGLVRVQRGDTFNVFSFRSPAPLAVTPENIAPHTFAESGLEPVAVVQMRR